MSIKRISTKTLSKSKNFWIYGKHPVIAALKNPKRKINKIIASDKNFISEFFLYINEKNIDVKIEKSDYINSFFNSSVTHQNYIAEVEYLSQPSFEDLLNENNSIILLLDQITDPHNVGAIIRSAAAFGVKAVISTNDNSANETASLIKAAAGMFELIPYIKIVNLSNSMRILKQYGFWCIGLDVDTNQFISSVKLPSKTAFIMGSEDNGLRSLTKKNCDMLIKLPMANNVESLNVSNAAAIALYEYQRQNNFTL